MLSSSLHHYGDVIRQKLEGEKLERDKRMKELEKEVSALQTKLEE